jgi:retinaldehyde-binding protein 1
MGPIGEDVISKKQNILVHAFENLRLHLKELYDGSEDDNPTLQYAVLLDLNMLSLQSIVSAPRLLVGTGSFN